MRDINVKILACDSLGVRSMATMVETDVRIAIDPSAALGPSRYGLPPHKLELEELEKRKTLIRENAENSDAIVISHYHYDHYDPDEDFYAGKLVFVKDWKSNINASQKKRAMDFIPRLEKMAKEVVVADGIEKRIGKTRLCFSPPVFHGPKGSKLGWVIQTLVEYKGERFLHTSDVQGPLTREATDWIVEQDPDVIFLCGCLTYFLGWRYPMKLLDEANKNVIEILEKTRVRKLIIDHHLVRDLHFREKIKPVYDTAKDLGKEVMTGAEFAGEEEKFLEARRKQLWKGG